MCLKKIRIYPDKRARLLDALGLVERLDIEEIDVPIEPTIELAEKTGLSVYDTSYLWLARELRTGLVTLDAAMAKAVAELAIPLPP